MTRDEIINRPAGLELDELVAEKVIGWIKGENKNGMRGWKCAETGPPITDDHNWDGIWVYGSTPEYSTDIAAAWQVEEKIKELHLEDDYVNCLRSLIDVNTWIVCEEFYMMHADPAVRCRAALLAVMEMQS